MAYYRFPILQRIIELRKDGQKLDYAEIDGIGYTIICDRGDNPRLLDKELRMRPTIIKALEVFIRAEDPKQAIIDFHNIYMGAYFGDEWDMTAIYIDMSRPIIELECPLINENCMGELICGGELVETPAHRGLFGFCVLEDKINTLNCPMKEDISEFDIKNICPEFTVEVEDRVFSFLRFKKRNEKFTLNHEGKIWIIAEQYGLDALILEPEQGGKERIMYNRATKQVLKIH